MGSTEREFPNVKTFSLNLVERSAKLYSSIAFGALPQLRNVVLELPQCSDLDLPSDAAESESPSESLEELRCFHLKNCNLFDKDSVLTFLKGRGGLGKLEKVEIEGCYNLRRYKGDFKKMLGDKFVWKG